MECVYVVWCMKHAKEAATFMHVLDSHRRLAEERDDLPELRVTIHCTRETAVDPPLTAGASSRASSACTQPGPANRRRRTAVVKVSGF